MKPKPTSNRHPLSTLAVLVVVPLAAAAQQAGSPAKAQVWIDVATFAGIGMPGAGAAANPMAMLGNLMGSGAGAKNTFGQTQAASAGRWVDATLLVRGNPQLAEATWAVPAGFMTPALRLQSPRDVRQPVPEVEPEDKVFERDVERPRGRMLMFWGCGAAVRPGQPKVLDFGSMNAAELARFFVTRSATGRGAHRSPGRPLWPSVDDARMVPAQASLAGAHQFSGAGVPESFRFQVGAEQDLMPALMLQQQEVGGATELAWNAAPTARAYFVSAMGAGGREEMVLWTSSEQPDTGFGLADYQTNAAVDRWLREKVLLAPNVTRCTVPAGIFSDGGAMLRLTGYGNELNLAFPPRPTDARQRWDPDWAVKMRVKSVTSAMLGMSNPGLPGSAQGEREGQAPQDAAQDSKPKPLEILRGIFGR